MRKLTPDNGIISDEAGDTPTCPRCLQPDDVTIRKAPLYTDESGEAICGRCCKSFAYRTLPSGDILSNAGRVVCRRCNSTAVSIRKQALSSIACDGEAHCCACGAEIRFRQPGPQDAQAAAPDAQAADAKAVDPLSDPVADDRSHRAADDDDEGDPETDTSTGTPICPGCHGSDSVSVQRWPTCLENDPSGKSRGSATCSRCGQFAFRYLPAKDED